MRESKKVLVLTNKSMLTNTKRFVFRMFFISAMVVSKILFDFNETKVEVKKLLQYILK